MPKDRRDRSVSYDRYRASPFPCSSSRGRPSPPRKPSETEKEVKEWEEARCPVCMEHPHNAVLLLCSSNDKGCRPYMCDTSYRHSNCLDQFRKSFSEASKTAPLQDEIPPTDTQSSPLVTSETTETTETDLHGERSEESPFTMQTVSCDHKTQPKLVCPLCRGQINGWTVVEPARRFMNAKSRSCACETCEFGGTYTDLRKHARLEHPLVRPSEADPERQRNWRRMERQRDLGDLLSTLQSSFGEERGGDDSILPIDEGGWLTVFFLIRVFRPSSSSRSSSWSGTSRARAQLTIRRRSTRLWGESYEAESGSASRDEDNESSDGGSGPWRHARSQRRTTPDNQP